MQRGVGQIVLVGLLAIAFLAVFFARLGSAPARPAVAVRVHGRRLEREPVGVAAPSPTAPSPSPSPSPSASPSAIAQAVARPRP